MPVVDQDESGEERLNVGAVVGKSRKEDENNWLDVIVVHGLMRFIYDFGTKEWTRTVPNEPGELDLRNTETCILNFQNHVRRHPERFGFWVAGDSRVSPAEFGKDTCGFKQLYTISAMNNWAGLITVAHPSGTFAGSNHVDAICEIYPLVRFAVSRLNFGPDDPVLFL